MKGKYHITVANEMVKYDFDIRRNITIIKGDSATGKTTLVEMIREFYEDGESSGVRLNCEKECRPLAGRDWKILLQAANDCIVFIDENNDFLPTQDFTEAVQNSDNYYVIVTREGLPNLPYSVDEIYGIRISGKYAGLKQTYNEFYHIYGDYSLKEDVDPDKVIVEDSNAGFEFFQNQSVGKQYRVISAGGKSNVFQKMNEIQGRSILVIADGAAFGSEMDRVMKMAYRNGNITVYLPESFEWLILASGVVDHKDLRNILEDPSSHIDSKEFFSWERFFTHILIEITRGTWLQYSKRKINPSYLNEAVRQKIVSFIERIRL